MTRENIVTPTSSLFLIDWYFVVVPVLVPLVKEKMED